MATLRVIASCRPEGDIPANTTYPHGNIPARIIRIIRGGFLPCPLEMDAARADFTAKQFLPVSLIADSRHASYITHLEQVGADVWNLIERYE